MAVEHTEQDGAHDGVSAAAAVASVVEGALAQEFFPSPTGLKKLKKKDQLPLASDRSLIIPLDMEASAGSVQGQVSEGVPEVFLVHPQGEPECTSMVYP